MNTHHTIQIEWESRVVRAVMGNLVIAHIARSGRDDDTLKRLLADEIAAFLVSDFNPNTHVQSLGG